ncbi:MAG: type IV pilus modification PilV family protein [Terriglobales bacterium]
MAKSVMMTDSQLGSDASLASEMAARAGRPRRPSAGGFTLLETIFALFILCVGIAFLAATFGGSIRADANNQSQNASVYLANQKAEQIVRQLRCIEDNGGCQATFTDSYGQTTNVAPTTPALLNSAGEIDFTLAALPGYSETVTIGGPNCVVGTAAYCGTYDVRWNVSAPVAPAGGISPPPPGAPALYQITIGVRGTAGAYFAPVNLHVAVP